MNYVENHDEVINGSIAELIDKKLRWRARMLKVLKNLSRNIFSAQAEAEKKNLRAIMQYLEFWTSTNLY